MRKGLFISFFIAVFLMSAVLAVSAEEDMTTQVVQQEAVVTEVASSDENGSMQEASNKADDVDMNIPSQEMTSDDKIVPEVVAVSVVNSVSDEGMKEDMDDTVVPSEQEPVLVIREAKERGPTTVAVEGYLDGNIFNLKVIARMFRSRPRIFNCVVKGPKLGRLAPETRKPMEYTVEKEEPFITTKAGGFISFGPDEEEKEAKGALMKEMFQYVIPVDKIKKGKKYELWIKIQGTTKNQQIVGYKFELEDFYELLQEQTKND